MTAHYLFPHHIVLGYIALWTLAEVVAAQIWPIRKSCKKVSLLHCIVAFVVSSVWLIRRIWWDGDNQDVDGGIDTALHNFELPGTLEHHVVSLSFAYFIVDMPFAIAFHPAFIVHHAICIVARDSGILEVPARGHAVLHGLHVVGHHPRPPDGIQAQNFEISK